MDPVDYAAKRRQLRLLRQELEEEDWDRFVDEYPEKNLEGVRWDSLRNMGLFCNDVLNTTDVCRALDVTKPCVFCGREWEE